MKRKSLLFLLLLALMAPWTAMAQQITLLSENFDEMSSLATEYSATGWYAYNASSNNQNSWTLTTSYPNSGTQCVRYLYSSTYAADCYLVSAPFSVSATTTELSVNLYERTGSYAETFEVFFVKASDVTDLAGVATATQYSAIASATYNNTSYAPVSGSSTSSALAGQSVRVVVHCTSAADMYYLNIDDITVTEPSLDPYVALDPATVTVFTGFTQTLTATYGNVTGTPSITFTSSNDRVATVSGSGTTATVTGVAPGTATVTATMNYNGTDYTATCDITVEDPAYCTPYFSYSGTNYGLYIKSFVTEGGINNISNSSSLTVGGYADYFDSYSASIEAGETLSFTVTPGYTNPAGYAIWVDWNQDYEFSTDERVAVPSSTLTEAWNGTFTVPATTSEGDYRIRVMLMYGQIPSNPCISSTYGEAEDYKLTVFAALPCKMPTNLQYSEVGKRSVKLSWDETGEATAWQVCINGDEDHPVDAPTNPFVLTGLTPSTDYTVKVRANCGGSDGVSYWSNEVSFTTEVACPAPTNLTISDITPVAANANWTGEASNYDVRYGLYQSTASETLQYDNGTFATNVGTGASFYWAAMYPAGTCSGNFITKVSIYDVEAMTGAILIYNDGETAPANLVATMDIEFTGSAKVVDFTFDEPLGIDSNHNLWIVVFNESSTGYPAAACIDDGIVNNRWVSFDGNAWTDLANAGLPGYGWMIRAEVETVPCDGTIYSCTSNTYPLTGLDPATLYVFQVRSICGGEDGESYWTSVAFTTLATCTAPEGLEVSDVTARDATFTWTAEEGATFQYCYVQNPVEGYIPGDEEFRYETTDNTVTLTHVFEPETDYVFYLRKKCNATDFSESISVAFVTDVACHAPTNLTIDDITKNSANANWTGDAGNYEVQYGLYPEESTAQEWLTYSITQSTNVGSSSGSTRTWAVKYLGSEVTGNCLTKIEVPYDAGYNTDGDLKIDVYSGGDDAPGTLLYTEVVYPEASGTLTITLANPVLISTGENLWIALTETGTYVVPVGVSTEDNSRWYFNGSTWTVWPYLQAQGYGCIINGYMETLDLDAISWTPGTSTENTFAMTGLNPESTYIFQVRSVCGGEDGESLWVTTCFTTLPSCGIPTDLQVAAFTTTTATLKWVNGTADQTAWQIMLNDDEENLIEADSNPFIIENLTAGTAYTAKVRAVCSENDLSDWSDEISFVTECETIVVDIDHPFTEGFEGETFAPICWENIPTTYYDEWYEEWYETEWQRDEYYSHNGSASAYSSWYGDIYLVMPDLQLSSDASGAQLTFWSYNEYTTYYDKNSVVLLNGEEEIELWSPESVTSEWVETTIDLTAYLGQTISLAFKYEGDNAHGWYIDDVEVAMTSGVTLPIELSEGWNWISLPIAVDDPAAALLMLEEALGGNALQIKARTGQYTEYDDEEWFGTLTGITNENMYMIEMANAYTIELQGMPANPATYEISIAPGWNWIGFPSAVEMSVADAFADFEAEEDDELKGRIDGSTFFDGDEWFGGLTTLTPGQGYMYNSVSNETKTLVFPTGAKARRTQNSTIVEKPLREKKQPAKDNTEKIDNNLINAAKMAISTQFSTSEK